jgi:hypothetical protein
MKPKIPLSLALVWNGLLAGCSSTTPIAGTKVFDDATAGSSISDYPALTGLGSCYSIRMTADSWPALLQKAQPAFAWNGRDMMWIESDTNGQPQFVLDEAYIYLPTNQPPQWILVKEERASADPEVWRKEDWWRQFSMQNLRAIAKLQGSDPVPAGDFGSYGNYAVVRGSNPRFGVVYEIGWDDEPSTGSSHPQGGRRIYVFKDNANQWHFLGEGPGEGASRDGVWSMQRHVIWKEAKGPNLPLEIQFVTHTSEGSYPFLANDSDRCPPLTTCDDFILSSRFPSRLRQTTKRSYVLAQKGDTLDRIALWFGYWEPGWGRVDFYPEDKSEALLKKEVSDLWIKELARLNPQLPRTNDIKEGTRVEIPNAREVEKLASNIQREKLK